jgi:hypothetical protein
MALGVDLFGIDQAGKIIWHRMCRFWPGHDLLDLFSARLTRVDPEPSWECKLTRAEVKDLARQFDPPWLGSRFPNDADLNELLQIPETESVRLNIDEWGYG